MSLEALLNLRRSKRVPAGVWVVVGAAPKWLQDGPDMVRVLPSMDLGSMDWRPLFGLPVSVFEIGRCLPLLDRTLDAVQAASPKSVSLACAAGCAGQTQEHETVLAKALELLCR